MGTLLSLDILVLMLTLQSQVHTGEIYGGKEAVPHSRPYMVLLVRLMDTDKTAYCDGFLLREDFVMTAAHCSGGSITARLGLHNVFSGSQQDISVQKIIPHPDWTNPNDMIENDIMLLKLAENVTFTDHVRAIALPQPDNEVLPVDCVVSGWGLPDKSSNSGSPCLKEVNVTVIEFEMCTKQHLFCTKGPDGPAKGDSGGPLVCDGKAYGIVSMSYNDDDFYTYTSIPDFLPWVDAVMNNL